MHDLYAATILVVDDVPANTELLFEMLESAGFTNIHTSNDPYEGLALYERLKPDLVLLDYRMPGLDGVGFIRAAREMTSDAEPPILIVTAQNDEDSRRKALEAGARDYVTKPFAFWELLARTRTVLQLQLLYQGQRQQSEILDQQVRERTRELEETRHEIIRRLCTVGEFRDEDTGHHVVRIGRLSAELARLAGEPDEFVDMMLASAPLHDIGKIGVPDRVLLKPGRLDPEEMAIMRTHAQIGARILAGSGLSMLELAAEIALTHHERWDGDGYPAKLAGQAIPLSGRLVAVVDVFDALLSPRPYKQPWSIETTLAHLEASAGTHLDPHLTQLFLDNADTMIAIRAELADKAGDETGLT
ncbi:HD domain-containing phosphohydrolase [Radicibacter daui]|uniref:HD domain-containing phosphohydrolase n=1 Tax=Radicibacter daui TaxID=3064829 RepID=UPI004046CD5D